MTGNVIISLFDSIPLWVMIIPIVICSIIALAVVIERLIFFKGHDHDYRLIMKNVSDLVSSEKYEEARLLADRYSGIIVQIIKDALSGSDFKRSRERIVTESSENAVKGIERNAGLISTVATISPMLGLFGTVTGMMKSFSGLSRVGPAAHDLLAYGISEALITTAFGLLVAIPSLIFYNYMVSRIEHYLKEVERVANALLEIE